MRGSTRPGGARCVADAAELTGALGGSSTIRKARRMAKANEKALVPLTGALDRTVDGTPPPSPALSLEERG